MVARGARVVLLLLATSAFAEDEGPVLWGDGPGGIWKWQGGEKTLVTEPGTHLGGVAEDWLWGWKVEGSEARTFTLELPKDEPKATKDAKPKAAPLPVFDPGRFPAPDRIDRGPGGLVLGYSPPQGPLRVEVYRDGLPFGGLAWDDGRVIYGLSQGPEGWMVVGRTSDGRPWLNLSGADVPAPAGWRGRLTVAAWVVVEDGPVQPRAAGWGAPGASTPSPLFWGPEGWTIPDPEGATGSDGVFPLLGAAGEDGTLLLAGWKADAGSGALRPWFWDGQAEQVPGGAADGQPQAFGSDKAPFLVVRHQSEPWFTLEDGHESVPLPGLGPDDRVVAAQGP